MIPVLSEKEARWLDEITINSGHRSGFELMRSAGCSVAVWFLENVKDPFRQNVLVISGKGNNGGDGIVTHHYLLKFGVKSRLMLMDESEKHRPLLDDYKIPGETIHIYNDTIELSEFRWIIDAIFGIGLKRDVSGHYHRLIERINTCKNVISVDLPSGIYTDTGLAGGIAVKAEHTITMGYCKYAHLMNDGKDCSGTVIVKDIGFKEVPDEKFDVRMIDDSDIRCIIKPFRHNEYKYSRGRVCVFAGSAGMTGAAILACGGAMRSGCGILRAPVPSSLGPIFETAVTEAIFPYCNDDDRGYLQSSNFKEIVPELDWADSVLIGPGLSSADDSIQLMCRAIRHVNKNLVLDASGFLPLIKGDISVAELPAGTIITPHYGEFSNIFGIPVSQVKRDPIGTLRSVAGDLGETVLILKGSPTFIVADGYPLYMISEGGPILATAGTGDVLAGLITGLLAQGYSPVEAGMLGVFIHARAGRLFMEDYSDRGMVASHLVNMIPNAFKSITHVN